MYIWNRVVSVKGIWYSLFSADISLPSLYMWELWVLPFDILDIFFFLMPLGRIGSSFFPSCLFASFWEKFWAAAETLPPQRLPPRAWWSQSSRVGHNTNTQEPLCPPGAGGALPQARGLLSHLHIPLRNVLCIYLCAFLSCFGVSIWYVAALIPMLFSSQGY